MLESRTGNREFIWSGLSPPIGLYLVGVTANLSRNSRIPIVQLQISSKCTSYSSAGTEALLKSSSEIILWRLNMLLKVSVDTEN